MQLSHHFVDIGPLFAYRMLLADGIAVMIHMFLSQLCKRFCQRRYIYSSSFVLTKDQYQPMALLLPVVLNLMKMERRLIKA